MQPPGKKTLPFGVAALISLLIAIAAIPAAQEKPCEIHGSILINITYYGYNFIEFKFHNGKFLKTSQGKTKPFNKEKNIPYSYGSEGFKKNYSTTRDYHYEEEGRLGTILSQYNLEEFYDIVQQYDKTNDKLEKDKYFLTGPSKKLRYSWEKYADFFNPNQQFSFFIYHYLSPNNIGALIDVNSKEISFPFGLDPLNQIVWNREGQHVAYATPKNRNLSQAILVIKDIPTGKTLLRKDIGKYVSDITWSPDSSAVALLTFTDRISKWPGELLAAVAGHPYFIRTFYLEVYDLSGNLLYKEKVNGEFKSSEGRLVWIP
jgi:hypothetical protein